jgi:hypothetical protein
MSPPLRMSPPRPGPAPPRMGSARPGRRKSPTADHATWCSGGNEAGKHGVARSDADGWASDALVGRRGMCVVESDLAAAARSCASQAQIGGARVSEVANC